MFRVQVVVHLVVFLLIDCITSTTPGIKPDPTLDTSYLKKNYAKYAPKMEPDPTVPN